MLCTCSTMKSRSDSTLWITNSAGLSGKKSDPQSFAWAAAFRRLCSHLLTNRAVCDLTDAMGKLLNGENSGISHLVRAAPAGAEDRQKPLTPIRLTRPEARRQHVFTYLSKFYKMKREGGKFWRLYSQQSPGVVSHRVSKEVDGWCRLSNEHLPAKASSVALDPSLG